MTQKLTFLDFCNQLSGYNFFSQKGNEIYKYEFYQAGISPGTVFKKYKSVLRPQP